MIPLRTAPSWPRSGSHRISLIAGAACFALAATGCAPVQTPTAAAKPVHSARLALAAVKRTTDAATKTSSTSTAAIHPTVASVRPSYDDIRVVAAAGVRQWINCQGTGKVTVVVITGLGSAASGWWKVRSQFRATTRTCFYDRPGLGHSPVRANRKQVLDAGLYAHELKALLTAAREPGPYLILGHSFGGLVARAFAYDYPAVVRGVLLAESVDPHTNTGDDWPEAGHIVDMDRSKAATGGGPALGAKPLLVLSASHPEGDHLGGPTYGQPPALTKQWRAEQHNDTRLSTDSIQVIAPSGHVLQVDAPAAVTAALRLLVHAMVTGRPLICTRNWATLSSTCRA